MKNIVRERFVYCKNLGGGYIGSFVNMSGCFVTADSIDELERRAKIMGRMMIKVLSEGIENLELKEITQAEYMKEEL